MAQIKNCLVCGKEFEVCTVCKHNIPEELQWRRVVCCEEHFHYHLPIIMYVRNKIDKETAKQQLNDAIKKYGNIEFCGNIKSVTKEILAENKKTKKVKSIEENVYETVNE